MRPTWESPIGSVTDVLEWANKELEAAKNTPALAHVYCYPAGNGLIAATIEYNSNKDPLGLWVLASYPTAEQFDPKRESSGEQSFVFFSGDVRVRIRKKLAKG